MEDLIGLVRSKISDGHGRRRGQWPRRVILWFWIHDAKAEYARFDLLNVWSVFFLALHDPKSCINRYFHVFFLRLFFIVTLLSEFIPRHIFDHLYLYIPPFTRGCENHPPPSIFFKSWKNGEKFWQNIFYTWTKFISRHFEKKIMQIGQAVRPQ